jgi:hypothetical protein
VDSLSIEKDLYRKTIIVFFKFYCSFDKLAFSFEEIDTCSYDTQLIKQIWLENRTHIVRKNYYLQKLKEDTTAFNIKE